MPDVEIDIVANDSRSKPIIERTNAAINRMEAMAAKAARGMQSAFGAMSQALEMTGKAAVSAASAFLLFEKSKGAIVGAGAAIAQHRSQVEFLTNTYRAARLALAPTLFTALSLGAATAATEILSLTRRVAGMVEIEAKASTFAGIGYEDYQRLGQGAARAGKETSLYVGAAQKLQTTIGSLSANEAKQFGLSLETMQRAGVSSARTLGEVGEAAGKLDAFDKAALAVRLFGADADKYLPLLDDGLKRNIGTLDRWSGVLSRAEGKELLEFENRIRSLGVHVADLKDEVAVAAESMYANIAYFVAISGNALSHLDEDLENTREKMREANGQSTKKDIPPTYAEFTTQMKGDVGFALNQRAAKRPRLAAEDLLDQRSERFNATQEGIQKQISVAQTARQKALDAVGTEKGSLRAEQLLEELANAERDIKSLTAKLVPFENARQRTAAEQSTRESLSGVRAQMRPGFGKEAEEMQMRADKLSTAIDKDGNERKIGLTEKAGENIWVELAFKFSLFQKKVLEEQKKGMTQQIEGEEKLQAFRMDALVKRSHAEQTFRNETMALDQQAAESKFDFESTFAERDRDRAMRALEGGNAHTLRQKIALEGQKAKVEEDYTLRVFALKADTLRREQEMEISNMEMIARIRGMSETDIAARRDALIAASAEKGRQLEVGSQAKIDDIRESAMNRQTQLVIAANQKQFDEIKRAADGLFDAMLRDAKTFGQALTAMLKVAFLTPIKNAFSNLIAGALTGTYGGGGGGGGQSGGGGGRGGILDLLLGGGQGQGQGPFTPPFVGGANGTGGPSGRQNSGFGTLLGGLLGGGGPAGGGSGGGAGAQSGGLAGLKQNGLSSLTQLGQIGATNKMFAKGVYGAKGGAMLGVGAALAYDGLRRGGVVGLGETVAGGALIGMKFGGPVGALIGAGIGAIAGTIRLFIKGAADKLREKIKSVYGVDIKDKGLLGSFVEQAKSAFGGDIDLAIRSPQIRETIELYAMMTGQKASGMAARMQSLSLVQQGGALSTAANFSNGIASGGLDQIARGSAGSAGGGLVLQLDGPATTSLLRGEAVQAVQDNPRVVQSAVQNATRGNVGRRDMLSMQLAPGTLTS